jgi:hypothetical protein
MRALLLVAASIANPTRAHASVRIDGSRDFAFSLVGI